MNQIFVFGSINMDLVFQVPRIPLQGETIQTSRFFMTPGGKGANQAVACAKQGAKTWMIASVGNDPLSKESLENLTSYSVDTTYVSVNQHVNGGVAGILLEDGDNRILVHPGANAFVSSKDAISAIHKLGKPGDVLVAQLEIPIPAIHEAFVEAKKMGMTTILNAAPAKELPNKMFQGIDMLCVNETEMAFYTQNTDFETSASMLLKKGVGAVLFTKGAEGSQYVDSQQSIEQKAYPVQVVDTTAAGDTYLGAFVSQRILGRSIPDSMNYAACASSLAIQKEGAQISIPSAEQVQQFYHQQKEKL